MTTAWSWNGADRRRPARQACLDTHSVIFGNIAAGPSKGADIGQKSRRIIGRSQPSGDHKSPVQGPFPPKCELHLSKSARRAGGPTSQTHSYFATEARSRRRRNLRRVAPQTNWQFGAWRSSASPCDRVGRTTGWCSTIPPDRSNLGLKPPNPDYSAASCGGSSVGDGAILVSGRGATSTVGGVSKLLALPAPKASKRRACVSTWLSKLPTI